MSNLLLLFAVLFLLPIGLSAAAYWWDGTGDGWRTADRSSIGALPPPLASTAAVRIFSARTVSWRGIVASHSWIVFKRRGTTAWTRYDYTAWGDPVRRDGFVPDGRWFGHAPETVFAADGDPAEAAIAPIEAAVRDYAWHRTGDYRAWPGPNSNTFVQAVLDAVPSLRAALPNTAIGKDYPYDGRVLRRTATGVRLTFGGYVALSVGWVEGVELDLAGAVFGLDVRRPALKLPGIGRLGLPISPAGLGAVPARAACCR